MARLWMGAALLGCALAPSAEAIPVKYTVELAHDSENRWTGFGELETGADGRVSGEMCLSRTEFISDLGPARGLLRIPVSGRGSGDRIELDVPRVADGPVAEGGTVMLDFVPAAQTPDGQGETWKFGELEWQFDEQGNNIGTPPSETIRYLELVEAREPAEGEQVANFMAGVKRDDQVALVENPESEDSREYLANLVIYDGFTREEAIAFEQRNHRVMLYSPRLVLAIVDSANLAPLQAALDELGDGARILNLALKDCVKGRMMVPIAVPPLLELWYTRRLQASGLVASAYPEAQPRDPGWTAPFLVRNAALASRFANPRVPMAEKYKTLWMVFERALVRFASLRRPGFTSRGSIVRRGGMPPFIYMAELTGPSLAVCGKDRWERITVQATVNTSESMRDIAVSLQMSEGFFARGATLPSDARFRDNKITDGELARLQDLFVGAIEPSGPASGVKCP